MRQDFRLPRWVVAVASLTAITLGIAAIASVPVLAMNQRQCEKWPYPVDCYEYANRPSFGCFRTLCDATAAGFPRCTRNLKPTCD